MTKNALSKTQIDRLGDRLKGGGYTESDLRLLDDYRRSFGEAYEAVLGTIQKCGEFPTGRLAKSTHSIVEKLRRESIRLSQMQDIAGCRVVVADIVQQEQFVASLRGLFPEASVIDRRDKPSYGYRAVHIITEISGKPIEIQVRTSLQHLWAEVSEKASDVVEPTIKYGGGSDDWRNYLTRSSEVVMFQEKIEKAHYDAMSAMEVLAKAHEECKKAIDAALAEHHRPDREVLQTIQGSLEGSKRARERLESEIERLRGEVVCVRTAYTDHVARLISLLDKLKEQEQ